MANYSVTAPNGKTYDFQGPEGASQQQQVAALLARYPEAAKPPPPPETGFTSAFGSGLRGGFGSAAQGVGELTGIGALTQFGTEQKEKAGQTFRPTSEEDIAKAQGIIPTAGAYLSKYITEPVGEVSGNIIGRYGIPIAAAAGAAALAPEAAAGAVAAPLLAEGAIGSGLLSFLGANTAKAAAGEAAFAAVNAPTHIGELLAEQKRLGQKPDYLSAIAGGLTQTVIDQFTGSVLAAPMKGVLGRTAAQEAKALAPKVLDGTLSTAEAMAKISGTLRNFAQGTAQNAVVGTGMMVGNDVITRAATGQDLTSDEAMQSYGKSALGAVELSPFFGALHGFGAKSAAQKELTKAGDERANVEATKEEAIKNSPDYLLDLHTRYQDANTQLGALKAAIPKKDKAETDEAKQTRVDAIAAANLFEKDTYKPILNEYKERKDAITAMFAKEKQEFTPEQLAEYNQQRSGASAPTAQELINQMRVKTEPSTTMADVEDTHSTAVIQGMLDNDASLAAAKLNTSPESIQAQAHNAKVDAYLKRTQDARNDEIGVMQSAVDAVNTGFSHDEAIQYANEQRTMKGGVPLTEPQEQRVRNMLKSTDEFVAHADNSSMEHLIPEKISKGEQNGIKPNEVGEALPRAGEAVEETTNGAGVAASEPARQESGIDNGLGKAGEEVSGKSERNAASELTTQAKYEKLIAFADEYAGRNPAEIKQALEQLDFYPSLFLDSRTLADAISTNGAGVAAAMRHGLNPSSETAKKSERDVASELTAKFEDQSDKAKFEKLGAFADEYAGKSPEEIKQALQQSEYHPYFFANIQTLANAISTNGAAFADQVRINGGLTPGEKGPIHRPETYAALQANAVREAAPKISGQTDRQQRAAFGTALGAAQSYPGELRGRVNLPAQRAAIAGNFQGVLNALAKSKNVVVAEIARLARALKTSIKIDEDATETYMTKSPVMRQMSIDGAKMHLEVLDKLREAAPEVDKLPAGAALPYSIRHMPIDAIDGGKIVGRLRLDTVVANNHSMFSPLDLPENRQFRTKEDFQQLLTSFEKSTKETNEEELRLTATASSKMQGVGAAYDLKTDTIHVSTWYSRNEDVLAHEIAHAQLSQIVANPNNQQRPIVKRLNDLYEYVKKDIVEQGGEKPYGVESIQEFLAEGMGKPSFQYTLSRIKYENTSALGKFVETIAKLLGIKNDNAFTELLSIYKELMPEETKAPGKAIEKAETTGREIGKTETPFADLIPEHELVEPPYEEVGGKPEAFPKKVPETPEQEAIRESDRAAKQAQAAINKEKRSSANLLTALEGRLSKSELLELGDLSKNKSIEGRLRRKSGKEEDLSTIVGSGELDNFLPPSMRSESPAFDEYAAMEHIRDKLRQNDYLAEDAKQNISTLQEAKDLAEARSEESSNVEKGNIEANSIDTSNLYRTSGAADSPSLKKTQVANLVDRITKGWTNKPDIQIHATEADLPQHIRNQAEKDGVTGTISGVYDPVAKVMHIVAEHMHSAEDVIATIAHEIAGHYGLREMLGEKYGKTMDNIYKGNKAVREAADEMMKKENLTQRIAVEEVLADMAEKKKQTPEEMGALRNMYNAIKDWVKDKLGLAVSDRAVQQIVANARKYVIEGGEKNRGNAVNIEPVFRATKYAAGFEKSAALASKVLASEKKITRESFKNDFGANSLRGIMKLQDQFIGYEKLAQMKTPEGKRLINATAGGQMMYYLRFFQQRLNFLSDIVKNGALQRKEIINKDGSKEYIYTTTKGGASLAGVAKILSTINGLTGSSNATNNLFSMYAIAQRAKNVGFEKLNFDKEGKNGITEQGLRDSMKEIESKPGVLKAFKEAHVEYQKYNEGMIDFAVQTGAMTPKLAETFLKNKDYVPYYRQDSAGNISMLSGGKSLIKIGNIKEQPYLHELVGGDSRIIDFMESSVRNSNMLLDMGMRNQAIRNAMFELQKLGMAHIRDGAPKGKEDVVRFKDGGKEMYAVVQSGHGIPSDVLVKGLEGIPTNISTWLKIMGAPSKLLREAFMANPLAAARNFFKDTVSTAVVAGSDFGGVIQSIASAKDNLMQHRGLVGGELFTGNPSELSRILRQVTTGNSDWVNLLAKAHAIHAKADATTRQIRYDSYIKQGLSERDATLMTLESSNFTKRGTSPSLHYLNALNPFLNSQIQGFAVLLNALGGKMPFNEQLQIRQKMLQRGMLIAGTSMLYAIVQQDNSTYKNATPDQKYNNWFMPFPGMDEPIRIPIPFEAGILFKAVPEAMINYIYGHDRDAASGLTGAAMRIIPGAETWGMPQLFRPAIEAMTNTTLATRKPIQTQGELHMVPSERIRTGTSGVAQQIGQALDMSPVLVDHLIGGYTSSIGMFVAHTVGSLMKRAGVLEPAESHISQLPLIGSTFQPVDGGAILQDANDVFRHMKQVKDTYTSLIKNGQPERAIEFLNKNADEYGKSQIAETYFKVESSLAKQLAAVNASKETPKRKQELIDIIRAAKSKEAEVMLKAAGKS